MQTTKTLNSNIILLYLLVSLAMNSASQLSKVSLLLHNSVYVQLFCGFITKPMMFQIIALVIALVHR